MKRTPITELRRNIQFVIAAETAVLLALTIGAATFIVQILQNL